MPKRRPLRDELAMWARMLRHEQERYPTEELTLSTRTIATHIETLLRDCPVSPTPPAPDPEDATDG